MIYIKSQEHIAKMQIAGKISKEILIEALNQSKAGVKLIEIETFIDKMLLKNGVTSWFKEVDDYKYCSCISVNDVLVHGVPNEYVLKEQDLVSIDIGVKYQDAYVDNCWTSVVGLPKLTDLPKNFASSFKYADFLNVGVSALYQSIDQMSLNNRTGAISHKMQTIVQNAGYNVVMDYTGHGVGYEPHEDPHIPCFGSQNSGVRLKNGMAIAVEVMYTFGDPTLIVDKSDGWSAKTLDSSVSAMFEHTVVLKNGNYQILTD